MIGQVALDSGDCFARALPQEHGCPLRVVGAGFTHTDVDDARRLTG